MSQERWQRYGSNDEEVLIYQQAHCHLSAKRRLWNHLTSSSYLNLLFHLRQTPLLIGELLLESLSNLRPRRHPDSLFTINVLDKVSQSLEPTRTANDSAMKTDSHHLRRTVFAFFIQCIEGILQMREEAVGVTETTACSMELEVVAVVRVWSAGVSKAGGMKDLRRHTPSISPSSWDPASDLLDRPNMEPAQLAFDPLQ